MNQNQMTPDELLRLIQDYRVSQPNYGTLDGVLYNGGVVLTLFCTGAATILGAKGVSPDLVWVAPFLTGLATIFVGIDRALQFGPRWMHHVTFDAAVEMLIIRVQTINALPEDARPAEITAIRNSFVELPGMKKVLPGVGEMSDKS